MSIKSLNQKLKDALGVAPNGDPMFAWKHASELAIRQLWKDGYQNTYEMHDGTTMRRPANQWAVAAWQEPPYTLSQHRAVFGDTMPYSRRGRYCPSDVRMPIGVEPTERYTDLVIDAVKRRRYMSELEKQRHFMELDEKSEAETHRVCQDIIQDSMLPFGHVPGAKDHVSIGGI